MDWKGIFNFTYVQKIQVTSEITAAAAAEDLTEASCWTQSL